MAVYSDSEIKYSSVWRDIQKKFIVEELNDILDTDELIEAWQEVEEELGLVGEFNIIFTACEDILIIC